MRVLLNVLHYGLLRNFESVVTELASREHEIFLAAEEQEHLGGLRLAQDLASRHPRVHLVQVPSLAGDTAARLSHKLRVTLDYLRFAGPRYAEFPKLRERMHERVPDLFLRVLGYVGRRLLQSVLELLERAIPPNPALVTWLGDLQPDVVLLGSLTHYRSLQPDLLRAAIDARLRTAACVYSWDHLSSKALLRDWPDSVMVWNDAQRQEAIELHGIPSDRIVVTGAQCYDQWFDRRPSRDHRTFCRAMGLNPEKQILLYVCSALTPSPNEPAFVVQWIERLRASGDARLHELGVLVRPHPEREHEWDGIAYQHLPNVVLHGRSPLDAGGKDDYFDALSHASAVVGLVTSAFLEAAIVGRPVLTLTLPHFKKHQEGVLHFRYLTDVEGGLLQVARGFDEHMAQLADVLRDGGARRVSQDRFLRAFVRPDGLATPSTPAFVRHVEDLARLASRGLRRRSAGRWLEPCVPFMVRCAEKPRVRSLLLDSRERQREELERQRVAAEAAKRALRDQRYAEKRALKAVREPKAQRLQSRIARRAARVRGSLLRVKTGKVNE